MVESSPSSSSFSHRCRLRWLYDRPSPSVSVGVGGEDGVTGVEGVAQGLSSPPSGLKSPPRSLYRKKEAFNTSGQLIQFNSDQQGEHCEFMFNHTACLKKVTERGQERHPPFQLRAETLQEICHG